MISLRTGSYNLYVLDPSLDQILKYAPTLDGNQFLSSDDYLSTPDESVADYLRLYVDSNVYTLTPNERGQAHVRPPPGPAPRDPARRRRHPSGPPVPPHRRHGQSGGRLYVYDEKWNRILVFLKSDGSYVDQWSTKGVLPSMADMRGMYVSQPPTQKGQSKPPPARVVWATPQGIYRSQLTPVPSTPSRRPPRRRTRTPDPEADQEAQGHQEARLRHRERAACPRM